jgi:hypothetical protein
MGKPALTAISPKTNDTVKYPATTGLASANVRDG